MFLLLVYGLTGHAETESIIELFERSQTKTFVATSARFDKLEAELEKQERSGNPDSQFKQLGLEIARIHLNAKNYQLALWALDRTGYYSEAEFIESFLKKTLSANTRKKPSSGGIQEGNDGIDFFEKNESLRSRHLRPKDGATNESFTYEFDRYIHLNRVPVNVPRGNRTRSLYVANSTESGISFNFEGYRPFQNGPGLPRSIAETYVFDFLIGATDRRGTNSLFVSGYGNRLILIDNADLIWSVKDQIRSQLASGLPPEPDQIEKKIWKNARALLNRIYAIEEDSFHKTFDSMIGYDKVELILQRISLLKASDPYISTSSSCGQFYTK